MPDDTSFDSLDSLDAFDEAVDRLCVLDDPARRATYAAVRAARRPVTRAEVAEAAGISVRLAAFHLEKLRGAGYVVASFGGAGRVGRPAKRYAPSDLELEVSLPPRRYDLVSQILAEALMGRADGSGDELDDVAYGYGRRVGARVPARPAGDRFMRALRVVGYEPMTMNGDTVLRNCPFHRAAESQPEIVCRMNRAFVAGILAGTRTRSRTATLEPLPGRCCVVLRPGSHGPA